MTYRISKNFTFSAAHHLPQLPPNHKCHRPHGHNYRVRLELEGELDERGFVVDYAELDAFGDWLMRSFDHRDLNDELSYPPTAEHLARECYTRACIELGAALVARVGVSETEKTWAWYEPD